MKMLFHLIPFLAVLPALAANGVDDFSDSSYDIAIVRDGIRVDVVDCVTFARDGRFFMASEPLSMQWTTQIQYPGKFMAVTAPGPRTVVPYQFGLHGDLREDGTILASGIDEYGSTVEFQGTRNDYCGRPPRLPPVDSAALVEALVPQTATWQGGRSGQLVAQRRYIEDLTMQAIIPVIDPCAPEPGAFTPCDPEPDPLRAHQEAFGFSRLAGGRFRLTLGTSRREVREYCWAFDASGTIVTEQRRRLKWSPDGLGQKESSFQTVGTDGKGQGISYHGVVIGDNLLYVAGIEAQDGESVAAFGYGMRVLSCEPR